MEYISFTLILSSILITFLIAYLILSFFFFFFLNSNILPFRRYAKYDIQIPAKLKYFGSKRVAYWEAIQNDVDKNVILLHGFTRNSGRMNKRASIYWERGYNVYMLDNLGHGKSDGTLFPSGFQYSFIVRQFINEKKIKKPVLHGASMGAIASSYIAQKEPDIPKFIVCEALPHNFDNLYYEMMGFMKIPSKLFFWLDWVSRKIVWRQFIGREAEYDVSNIKCPMILIHGELDAMFRPELHFNKIIKEMAGKKDFNSWLVPDSRHTRMDRKEDYEEKLIEFLTLYE